MSAPLLTAALIVRDEEHNLPECVGSLDGIAEEIVVVDTGSTDSSIEVAKELGATVLSHPWGDDFSAARNAGLEVACGEWILYLDADERLRPLDRDALVATLRRAREAAFRVLLRPHVGATPFFEYRLWRADPEIRFKGVIHEQIVSDIHRVAVRDGRSVTDWPGLEIDHLGYEGDQAAKHARNLPLLRRQLDAEPSNIFNWSHLARVLRATGDAPGAEQALEEAVALARLEESPSSHSSLAWGDLVRLRHARGGDVTSLLAEGKARWPENWLLVWIEGNIRLDSGELEAAAACFRRLLEVDIADLPAQGVSYDGRLFGSFAHSSLGLALFRLERYEEAAEAYANASRLEPDVPEHEAKRALAEARAHARP